MNQTIYDRNIAVHGENHRVFMAAERALKNNLAKVLENEVEGKMGRDPEADELVEKIVATKELKKLYLKFYLNYLPRTVRELMINDIRGIHFEA